MVPSSSVALGSSQETITSLFRDGFDVCIVPGQIGVSRTKMKY